MKFFNLLTFTVLLTFFACTEKTEDEAVVINELKVATLPVKNVYYDDDRTLDLTGLVVTIKFSDDKEETVAYADFATKGIACEPANGQILTKSSTPVTITHTQSKVSTFFYANHTENLVVAINLITAPSKNMYYMGERFDLTGLVIEVTKSDRTKEIVTKADFARLDIGTTLEEGAIVRSENALSVFSKLKNISVVLPITFAAKLVDVEGNVYPISKIGNKVWMSRNLRTTKLKDGTAIAELNVDSTVTTWINSTTPSFNWFNKNRSTSLNYHYGAYYNFKTVQSNKLCPEGWHVPSVAEWDELTAFVNQNASLGFEAADLKVNHQIVISDKSGDWSDWKTAQTNNTYVFNATPSGYLDAKAKSDKFIMNNAEAVYWTTDKLTTDSARVALLKSKSYKIAKATRSIFSGVPVRCVQD